MRVGSAWAWRPTPQPVDDSYVETVTVGVVIPSYNEHVDAVVATIRSLREQTRTPDVVYVVDDGSTDRSGIGELMFRATLSDMRVEILPMAANRGKRFAQAEAWKSERCSLWALIDSDTTLSPDAMERMVATFADPDIHAATSLILPRQRGGLLQAIQEIEYGKGQLVDRLMCNWLGAVPSISGGFSMVREHVVQQNIEAYLDGWWGQHMGDDRHVCILANVTGKVIEVPEAMSWTAVPDTLPKLLKQRTRWAKSPYLATVWAVRKLGWKARITKVVLYFMAMRLVSYVFFALLLTTMTAHLAQVWYFLMYLAVFSWLRSFSYLTIPHPEPRYQYLCWLIAPVSQVFSLLVYIPVQLYALVTVRKGGWGTR